MLPMIPHCVMVCRGAWRLYEFVEFVPLRDQRRMEIERHGALQVAGYIHEVFGQWVGVEYAEYIMQDVLNLLNKRDAEEEAKAA